MRVRGPRNKIDLNMSDRAQLVYASTADWRKNKPPNAECTLHKCVAAAGCVEKCARVAKLQPFLEGAL